MGACSDAGAKRLKQVVSNLLANGIKYSPNGGRIIINISKERECLKIAVTDFGIGIHEEKLPFVFDRFFRVEKTSRQFQGLGIGLYISKEIVEKHGGDIWAESQEGEGSTFFFRIPIA